MLLQEPIIQVQTVITVEEDHLEVVVHTVVVAVAAEDQPVAVEEDNYF
jgi:hypothetical protein